MTSGAEKINNKKIITGFLILTVILGIWGYTVLQAYAQLSTVDWSPTFHHDLGRTGYSTSTGPLTNQTLWSYPTDNSVEYTSPAVVNGVVYVGSHDHYVYALNAETGTKIWSFQTGDSVESSPSVANGVVYVGSNDHNVYALNATTSGKIWNYTTGSEVESSPSIANGVVYIGSDDNNVYAFGSITVPQPSPSLPSPSPSPSPSASSKPSTSTISTGSLLIIIGIIIIVVIIIGLVVGLSMKKRHINQ